MSETYAELRKKFEEWAKSPRGDGDFLGCDFMPGVTGWLLPWPTSYADPYTDSLWECWQAAQPTPESRDNSDYAELEKLARKAGEDGYCNIPALMEYMEAAYKLGRPTPEINDKNGWVYDPGKALANLRRAEAAEAKLADMSDKLKQAARKIADGFIKGLKVDGIKSTPEAQAKVESAVLEILRETLSK